MGSKRRVRAFGAFSPVLDPNATEPCVERAPVPPAVAAESVDPPPAWKVNRSRAIDVFCGARLFRQVSILPRQSQITPGTMEFYMASFVVLS